MAEFKIEESQFQRWVRIAVQDEAVRAEAGALSYMRGKIDIVAPVPGLGQSLKCMFSQEPLIRPRYSGRGEIFLVSSFGGFHIFELNAESWILESGSYWASDDSVKLGFHREPMVASYFGGEGFVDFQTKVSGSGRVVINAPGPVEVIELGDETLATEDKIVIARTAGVRYRIGRPTRSYFSYWLSNERYVRKYTGPGKVLMAATPYLNRRLTAALDGQDPVPSPG
jgi:uncharacterized protein (AIM24 family)